MNSPGVKKFMLALDLPLNNCVILYQSLSLFGPQFPLVKGGDEVTNNL